MSDASRCFDQYGYFRSISPSRCVSGVAAVSGGAARDLGGADAAGVVAVNADTTGVDTALTLDRVGSGFANSAWVGAVIAGADATLLAPGDADTSGCAESTTGSVA